MRLSGGQQARLALARTLFHGQKVLVLDDPFSAVDGQTEQEMMDYLRQVGKDTVILLISHRLRLFPQLDGVVFLQGGKGEFATHQAMLQENASYATLYALQQADGEVAHA